MRIFVAWLGLCTLVGFVERAAAQAAPFTKTPVAADGLVANLYAPANGGRRLPGIIVLGGSEGGMGEGSAIEAALLAEHGFAAMHLGYFDVPGRSKVLEGLPLEYFKTAIDWLRAQGNVDRDKIAVVGGSKGAEAALLIASLYPQIKAVVAGAPSSVVWPGIRGTRNGSSWTLAGADLPALPYGREGGFTSVFALR